MSSPFWLLALGMFVLFLAGVYTHIGKVWLRTRWIYRADEPKRYWFDLALYYLIGIALIGLFFNEVHAFSR